MASSRRDAGALGGQPLTDVERRLRIGVVGTGALGRHHVRLLSLLERADLVGIHDLDPGRSGAVAEEFSTRAFGSWETLAEGVEAMVVAVPTVDHAAIAVPLLRGGIHVLVEKPIAASLEQAAEILGAAAGRVLAVGHVEFYNPAVQRLFAAGGRPRFLEVERLSLFSPRSLDIDVVLDLMIHDLQIVQALDPSPVVEVRAIGIAVLSERIDIADARLELQSGCVAKLTASRVSAERVRRLRVFLEDRYYSLDYQQQTIKGFRLAGDPRSSAGKTSAKTIAKTIVPEHLEAERDEPLRRELLCFVDRCLGRPAPLVEGRDGARALETALAVVEAIAAQRHR